jgi:Ca-activated chloride channel family protein
MRATDIYPNRVTFAKQKIDELLKNTTAKVSLYAFSDKLYQIAPKSSDLNILSYLIKHLDITYDLSKSSNLYDAIKNIKEKNIIIFTDGTDKKDFSKIKELNKNITIYLTATKKPTPIKSKNGYLKNKNDEIVLTSANYNISQIGKVIPFSYKKDDINYLKSSKDITFSIKEFKELYQYPLYIATIALFFAFFSLKRFKFFIILYLFFYHPTPSNASLFDFIYINQAKKAYQNGDFKKAIKLYEKIAKETNSPKSFYNLANAYYKAKRYKLALETYKKVIAKSKELRYKTFFNMANCYYKLKDYNQAFNFYNLAKNLKSTQKVEKNLQIVQKFIDINGSKKDFANIIVNSTDNKKINSFKTKTLLIEITKGDNDETTNPW